MTRKELIDDLQSTGNDDDEVMFDDGEDEWEIGNLETEDGVIYLCAPDDAIDVEASGADE